VKPASEAGFYELRVRFSDAQMMGDSLRTCRLFSRVNPTRQSTDRRSAKWDPDVLTGWSFADVASIPSLTAAARGDLRVRRAEWTSRTSLETPLPSTTEVISAFASTAAKARVPLAGPTQNPMCSQGESVGTIRTSLDAGYLTRR
jgi:hypothetical protein